MESEREQIQAQLRETERGEAASWVTYPPTPRWWPFLFGIWTFAYAGTLGWLSDLTQAVVMLALVAIMLGLIAWARRQRGAWPSGPAPREIKRIMTRLFTACAVVAASAWLTGETVSVLAAALLAGACTTIVVARYEAAYNRAAAEVRERLA